MQEATGISYFWALVLGLVQGVAEFLPISSSGHLALVEHLGMGSEAPLLFDLLLHLATLLIVIWFFRRRIAWYLKNDFHLVIYVAVATVPAALVGFLCKNYFLALRQSPTMICLGLLVTSVFLAFASLQRGPAYQLRDLGWLGAAAIGVCQALALSPGISRSGATLSGGLICGVDREESFSFSFILSIPVILGAVALEAASAVRHAGTAGLFAGARFGPAALGFVAAGVSGYFALNLLERTVVKGKLLWFAGYCLAAAVAGLIYFNFIRR